MAREARAYGVPVITGNRGDIGRRIEPGRDGWVIDVSDEADLRHLLRHVNANPDNGRLEPRLPEARSAETAVDEFVRVVGSVNKTSHTGRRLRAWSASSAPAGPFDAVEGK